MSTRKPVKKTATKVASAKKATAKKPAPKAKATAKKTTAKASASARRRNPQFADPIPTYRRAWRQ